MSESPRNQRIRAAALRSEPESELRPVDLSHDRLDRDIAELRMNVKKRQRLALTRRVPGFSVAS